MTYYDNQNPYATTVESFDQRMAHLATESERSAFIRRTYLHLAGAISMFVALETLIFTAVPEATLNNLMRGMTQGYAWIAVMLAFVGVSYLANWWAQSDTSPAMQYAGLFLYVVAESVIFVPLLYMATRLDPSGGMLQSAGLITLIVFGGLTAFVFVTGADFSWLGRFLFLAGLVAMGAVICAVVFQLSFLGIAFSAAMIGLAGGYILYDTSNVLHHYRTDQHVAAALALFAAVALLFWYVLRLLMSLQRD